MLYLAMNTFFSCYTKLDVSLFLIIQYLLALKTRV